MPASTVNFDKTKTIWTEGYLWYGCAVPAAGSIITVVLDAKGRPTPDATENPNAIHLGYTEAGLKCHYKFTKTDATDNEHTAPHLSKITAEQMMIEGAWKQLLDKTLLSKISVGGLLSSITGGDLITFGGKQTITTGCIAVFAFKNNDRTKIYQFVIYDGYNEEGVEMSIDSTKETSSPLRFTGNILDTRAINDQMGYIFIPT